MTEAELTAAYEADLHARGQKTLAEMGVSAKVMATTNADLIHELRQIAEWSYDERDHPRDFIRLAALRLEALNRPSGEISEETLDQAFGAYLRAYDENNHMPHRTALLAALNAALSGKEE